MGYLDALNEEPQRPAQTPRTVDIAGEVVRYSNLQGATPYVVEKDIRSGKRRVVFHREINRAQRRTELAEFAQASGEHASPAGTILLHEHAYRVPPDDIPRIFPELTREALDALHEGKAEVWAARWTRRIPAGAQAMSGFIHVDAGGLPRSGDQEEFKPGPPPLHFIPTAEEAPIITSPQALRQTLLKLFTPPSARARLFVMAHDGGHDEIREMVLFSDKSGEQALAALSDRISRAEAVLGNPQVAIAVVSESSYWFGKDYKQTIAEAIAKGGWELPPCQQAWYPATIIVQSRDAKPPVVTKVIASHYGVEEQLPYKDKMLARIAGRMAENAPAYTPELAAEDAASAAAGATDEACNDLAHALGATVATEEPAPETPSEETHDPDGINLDIF